MDSDEEQLPAGRAPTSRRASTALFLGMVALVSATVVVGGIFGAIAVRMGNRTLRIIDESEGRIRGRAMAKTGVILGWLAMAAAVVALILWLMPRTGNDTNVSLKVRTTANMRQILQSCTLYAVDNNNAFPPHLAAVMAGYGVKPVMLLDARASTLPMTLPPGTADGRADWHTFAADVDAHCDFVYLGAGLRQKDFAGPQEMILYAKKWAAKKRLVGFADGHVEEANEAEFQTLLAAITAAREKRGLGPLN